MHFLKHIEHNQKLHQTSDMGSGLRIQSQREIPEFRNLEYFEWIQCNVKTDFQVCGNLGRKWRSPADWEKTLISWFSSSGISDSVYIWFKSATQCACTVLWSSLWIVIYYLSDTWWACLCTICVNPSVPKCLFVLTKSNTVEKCLDISVSWSVINTYPVVRYPEILWYLHCHWETI